MPASGQGVPAATTIRRARFRHWLPWWPPVSIPGWGSSWDTALVDECGLAAELGREPGSWGSSVSVERGLHRCRHGLGTRGQWRGRSQGWGRCVVWRATVRTGIEPWVVPRPRSGAGASSDGHRAHLAGCVSEPAAAGGEGAVRSFACAGDEADRCTGRVRATQVGRQGRKILVAAGRW